MSSPPPSIAPRRARYDATYAFQIIARRPLRYAEGADATLDRPAHVRAASGLAWVGDRLLAVQDDANFFALIEPSTGSARAVPLPAGHGGMRLFGDDRGTKAWKLDLEACVAIREGELTRIVAFGSGSKPERERIVTATFSGDELREEPRILDARSLYAVLHEAREFSGSELNLEGAAVAGATLWLFQRGNGAARDGRLPIDAVAELSLAELLAYLDRGASGPPPRLARIASYELGAIDGVPLSFTDATLAPSGALLFLASAEASADVASDGSVHGTRIGELGGESVRLGPLLDESGAPTRVKAEGIAIDPRDPRRLFLVVDMDDTATPSELLEVRALEP